MRVSLQELRPVIYACHVEVSFSSICQIPQSPNCGVQECYRPVETFLDGHNLVLQAEEHDTEVLINAVMASTARHALWLEVINLMMERCNSSHNVLYATGAH